MGWDCHVFMSWSVTHHRHRESKRKGESISLLNEVDTAGGRQGNSVDML